MSKNLIPEIARMLGVEIGEEFKFEGDNRTCWFDLDGLHFGGYVAEDEDNAMLHDLLCGKDEIVKLPWKPKQGETYWTFTLYDSDTRLGIEPHKWLDDIFDFARFKAGWIYRSYEEAEAALPAFAAEIGVEYEI